MNIATALNRKYLKYTAVMLYSICKNNPVNITAYLLHSELTDEDIAWIREALKAEKIEIVSMKVDSNVFTDKIPYNEEWSIETYYRLLLLDMLPDSVDRVIYLDVDMIVNKSLEELYNVEMGEDEIISTYDSNGQDVWKLFNMKQKKMFQSRYHAGYHYFNAGMMLMNIKKMRQKYNWNYYLSVMEEWNYEMKAFDQDILNYVHWQHIGYVDWQEFDLFARVAHNSGVTYEHVKQNAAIVHFTGAKPWETKNFHFPIEKLWWDYAKETVFYTELLEIFMENSINMSENIEQYAIDLKEAGEQMLKMKDNCMRLVDLNKRLQAMIESQNG